MTFLTMILFFFKNSLNNFKCTKWMQKNPHAKKPDKQSQETFPTTQLNIVSVIQSQVNTVGAFPNKNSFDLRLNKQKVISYGSGPPKHSKWWPSFFPEKAIKICFRWKKRDDAPAALLMNAQLRSTLLHSIVARAIITRAFINFYLKREQI